MASWDFLTAAYRLRRILATTVVTTSNIHKCFNGLEQFMLVPPALKRDNLYDYYTDEHEYGHDGFEYDEKSSSCVEFAQAFINQQQLNILPNELNEPIDVPGTSTKYEEEHLEEPEYSQFGPIGSPDHGHVLDLKFSTGIMGGIDPMSKGMTLEDVQKVDDCRSRQVMPPRWGLGNIISHGVQDC